MNIIGFIERSDYFQGISNQSRELLAGICIPKNLAKKEMLFYEGDKGHAFYLLAHGAVGLYKGMPDGREIVIKIVQPGEPFAEVVLFEEDRYPVSAIAMKSSLVFLLPKRQFYCLMGNEDFRNDFIVLLMKKQRYLAERIRYLTMYDVEDRFYYFIREHYGLGKVTVPLSKRDVAAAIGTTPETYSRLLTRLISEGKITTEEKSIYFTERFISEKEKNR